MSDIVIRGMAAEQTIRFFATDATSAIQELLANQELSVTAAVLLGRLSLAALLMGTGLKDDRSVLTLKVNGDGPLEMAIAECKSEGRIRGFVRHPEVELPQDETTKSFAVGKALGTGILTVIRDLGFGTPYLGQIELQTGEIGDDIAFYYAQSEQIPTAVVLGVLINPDASIRTAGGCIVQAMPNTPEHIIDKLQENITHMPYISDLLDMNMSIEDISRNIVLRDLPMEITDTLIPRYECSCSKESFRQGMQMLSREELEDMKDEPVVTQCRFCGQEYVFEPSEIRELINNKK